MQKHLLVSLLCFACLVLVRSDADARVGHGADHLRTKVVLLERAPGAFGELRSSSGALAITATDKGKELLVVDGGSGEVSTYLETGEPWGKTARLLNRPGDAFSKVFRFKASGNVLAFAAPAGVALFKRDTGEMMATSTDFHHALDVAEMPGGDWVVNLVWLPIPALTRVAHEKFGGTEPRLVELDNQLEISNYGLAADPKRNANQTAARQLHLAGSADRLYAAELANYKVYELDRTLKLRATYSLPSLRLEKGVGVGEDPGLRLKVEAEAARQMSSMGQDAAQGRSTPGRPAASELFSYQPAIYDAAWDPGSQRLLLLLAPGIAGDEGALDLLDPATGHIQRVLLRLPKDAASYGPLSQLAVGHSYLWLRNNLGRNPTLRLDRAALEDAPMVQVAKIE